MKEISILNDNILIFMFLYNTFVAFCCCCLCCSCCCSVELFRSADCSDGGGTDDDDDDDVGGTEKSSPFSLPMPPAPCQANILSYHIVWPHKLYEAVVVVELVLDWNGTEYV